MRKLISFATALSMTVLFAACRGNAFIPDGKKIRSNASLHCRVVVEDNVLSADNVDP